MNLSENDLSVLNTCRPYRPQILYLLTPIVPYAFRAPGSEAGLNSYGDVRHDELSREQSAVD